MVNLDELNHPERLLEESWVLRARRAARRELVAESAAAALFLACAAALAAAGGAGSVQPAVAALLVGLYAVVSRVKFPIGAGSVVPSQLVLVPMLLVLPPAAVPLLVAAGLFAGAAGGWLRQRAQPERILYSVSDSWHSLGPAVVLVVAGSGEGGGVPALPVLALAFAATCAVDLASGMLREAAALDIAPRLQIRVIAQAWVVDACLAPIGLLAALAIEDQAVAALAVLPLAGLLVLFARDRNGRIEQAQLQLELVRHERTRLQSAVRRLGEAFAAKLDLDALLDIVLRGSIEALDANGGRLVLTTPDGRYVLEQTPGDDIAAALTEISHVRHGDVWTVALPLSLGAAESPDGVVQVARRDRPFQPDEVELLRELVERAGTAAAEIIGHQELREQAFTDALTGLGNRRRLQVDIEDRCGPAAIDRPSLLILFDLNGFKRYNDTFGHPAGDALLARLGAKLTAAVEPRGTAYRLGGDEFCVLLDAHEELDDAASAAVAALSESGEEFSISAAYGAVLLPHEGQNPEQAIQRADERMYARKRGRASSPREQAAHVLMRAMEAKQPSLEDHCSEVANLAVAVARRLGMRGEGLDEVMRAAELHDIGKVGIPDAILNKPGSLDSNEWEFMRQHTILGERILLAAPALRPIASIVRASHERWDGTGYPDALTGEQIPLTARIVAVCDAFEAMTADRSYRAAMSHAAACEELRAMAGTQFDPTVIDAFLTELKAADPASPAEGSAGGTDALHEISAQVQELLAERRRPAAAQLGA